MSGHARPARLSNADLGVFFEPHHHALADHLHEVGRALLAEEDRPHPMEYAAEVAAAMGQRWGLYRWLVPAEGPTDVRALCLIREALGYASPLADSIFAVHGLGSSPILAAGSTEQRACLPRVRAGETICAFGLTEPGAGSDLKAMETTATREGDGFVLDGEKTFISNVGIAHQYTVFARLGAGFAAFLVPADVEGLESAPIPMSADHPLGRLTFRSCRLPRSALLGDEKGGLRLALGTLDTFRVSVGGAAVGMARRALDEALTHTRQRIQFGKPLRQHQMVQALLADMATELDAARLLVLRAAHRKDSGERATAEVSMAKLFATEAAQRIVDSAVQLLGGLGVVLGQAVERLYREVRPLRIYEGTSEIQRLIIARELLAE